MAGLKQILLAEDNPHDVELTLAALKRSNIANEVVVTRDGAEVLDFLRCRGAYASRLPELPVVLLLDLKILFLTPIRLLNTENAY